MTEITVNFLLLTLGVVTAAVLWAAWNLRKKLQ